jgi:rhodanese-related sulfurtransferase
MAPLVPDLVSNELSILSALLVGVAFGYVLEQAGFSSSRRLAGLFYGYDFTVLRVFFTAAITAMAGVLVLGRLGLLDLDFIYVNPTFLGPAIAGGAIMGLGFVLGGYCPGTSVCAAAIGKKDAIAFVAGGFLGVLLYGEAYPAVKGFADGGAMGPIKVYDSLGISRGLFALLLVFGALGAFAATTWIEKRVSADAPSRRYPVGAHRLAALGLAGLGLLVFVVPDRKAALLAEVSAPGYRQAHPVRVMTADELAFRVIDRDPRLLVVDLRGEAARTGLPLPGAVAVPLEGLPSKEWTSVLGRRHATRVFVDEDGSRATTGALLAERVGYDNVRVLEGGVDGLREAVLDFEPTVAPATAAERDEYRFRSEARLTLARMIAETKDKPAPVKKPVRKIQGGCS